MLVLNLPFKALMFLTLMRPSLVLSLLLWLKLVKDVLKVRCRLALLTFLISCLIWLDLVASLFFFNDTAPTEIYTLSLHDALPIYPFARRGDRDRRHPAGDRFRNGATRSQPGRCGNCAGSGRGARVVEAPD